MVAFMSSYGDIYGRVRIVALEDILEWRARGFVSVGPDLEDLHEWARWQREQEKGY